MAVKASGSPLSFSEIETEFGQNSDRDLGEYRVSQTVGGLSNQPLDTSIPQSGAIKFSDFYSKRLNVVIDYHSGSTENRPNDARTKYQAGSASGNRTVIGGFKDRILDNSSGSKVRIHVNKTIGSAVGNGNTCAVRTGSFETGTVVSVEVGSSGAIYGAGGNGGHGGTNESSGCGSGKRNGCDGDAGSSGLGVQFNGTTVFNNGLISAGYGGGGGGGFRKVEKEEIGPGPVYAAAGGGGGGGQGLPGGIGGGPSGRPGGNGTLTAGGNGGEGGEGGGRAHGGGGGGGGSNGTGGEGGNENDGTNGTSTSGGNGAQGTHSGSIEGENNVTGSGGTGGPSGAAIRRTSGITVTISNVANSSLFGGNAQTGSVIGVDDATGVS